MALQSKTIDDFCRLCAIESDSGVIIYSTEGENLCLEEKIINCLRIEVSRDDMLPKKVCRLCSELLEDYYRFSERAIQVQQTLGLLLGLPTSHVPTDEMELCLMQANVKMESNLIKNELDELMVQQNNIQIDGNKFDEVGVQTIDEFHIEEEQKKLFIQHLNDKEILIDKYDFNVPGGGIVEPGIVDNVRQIHRRKMTQPKRAACGTGLTSNKLEETQDLNEVEEIECLVNDNDSCQVDFKSEGFNECDFLQVLEKGKNNDENMDKNGNEDEEDSEIEKEWRKQWGIMCNQCKSIFPTKILFDKHYRLYYNKKPVYTCSYCKKPVEKYSAYRSHCFRHIYEGQFKCKFCDKKFCTKGMLQVHIITHNGPDRPYICEECGIGFSSQQRLNSHQKKHKVQPKKEFRCTECGKVLQTRGGLTAHLTVHKLGRRFMCHLCGKTFTQKINMQQHVKHHKGERPYSCENCGKSFAEKSHLNRHKSFHTLDRPYQCPVCKKMYKTERCLKVHSHVHLNTRPYVCSYCGKGFLSSTKLKQHYNCHTGERPFACKYCERTFTNYPNWLKHTRRRHKVDHKTGLSLKEESQAVPMNANVSVGNVASSDLDFVEIQSVEVKEDNGRSQIPHLVHQAMMAQFHEAQNNFSEFQIHSDSEFLNSQHIYQEQMTPGFRLSYKELTQSEI